MRARSDVEKGDRTDVAALKVDAALSRQNGRTVRCAAWYGRLKDGTAGRIIPPPEPTPDEPKPAATRPTRTPTS